MASIALDAGRLEDPPLPDGVGGELVTDLVDDLDDLVDVRPVGDRDVLVDPGPHPGEVGGDLDLPVGNRVHDPVEVAHGRPSQVEVLDRAVDAGQAHDVALGELVLEEDQGAVEVVADQRLGPEADRDAEDPEARDRRPDIEAELSEHHQRADDHDEELDRVRPQAVEGVHPLLELDRAQLLGGPFRGLAVEEGLDDPVHEQAREPHRDDRHDDDEDDRHEGLAGEGRDVAPGRLGEVGHRSRVASHRGALRAAASPGKSRLRPRVLHSANVVPPSSFVARICFDTRTMLDISQQTLADAVGVSRAYIATIESGRANPPLIWSTGR